MIKNIIKATGIGGRGYLCNLSRTWDNSSAEMLRLRKKWNEVFKLFKENILRQT